MIGVLLKIESATVEAIHETEMAKAKTAQPVFNLAGSPAGLSAV